MLDPRLAPRVPGALSRRPAPARHSDVDGNLADLTTTQAASSLVFEDLPADHYHGVDLGRAKAFTLSS